MVADLALSVMGGGRNEERAETPIMKRIPASVNLPLPPLKAFAGLLPSPQALTCLTVIDYASALRPAKLLSVLSPVLSGRK